MKADARAPGTRPLISIVTPVFNEEQTLPRYFETLTAFLDDPAHDVDFEVILTDNRSTDRTFEMLRAQCQKDSRFRAFRLSRNFGYQRSIWTGYSLARGDAAVELDADLQDPLEMVVQFIAQWRSGADVVYGIRRQREEGPVVTGLRRLYYKMIRAVSEDDLPADAGDFLLIDRRVLDYVVNTYDVNIYLRGVIFSLGFNRVGLPYDRAARLHGTSKFPLRKMLSLALDGFIRHSNVPLRIASIVGILFSGLSLVLGLGYIVAYIFLGAQWPSGFATLVLIQIATLGVLSMLLGIIGEYLARMYSYQRKEPMSIVDEAVDPTVMDLDPEEENK